VRIYLNTTEKAQKAGGSDGKKDGQYAFSEAGKVSFKGGGKKGGKRVRKGEKVTERKMASMHL
jgi:hypothetical protein